MEGEAGEAGRIFGFQVKDSRKEEIQQKYFKLPCIYFQGKSGRAIMQSFRQICPIGAS